MNNPIDELSRMVGGQSKAQKRLQVTPVHKVLTSWAEAVEHSQSNPLGFGIPTIDEDLEYDLRGKVIAVIGYQGTKKSLLALQGGNYNAMAYKSRILLSSMEMTANLVFERELNYCLPHYEDGPNSYKVQAAQYWKERIKQEGAAKVIDEIESTIKDFYGDSVLISDTPRMSVNEYKQLLDRQIRAGEPIDMIIVDGLSRMESKGSETESYSNNIGDLKDLANEYNVGVVVICHCSKTSGGIRGTKHSRDNTPFVRGSEKILDDIDCVISMSLYQDPNNPEEYLKDEGHIRYWGKRNTGNVINLVYSFDPMKLTLNESTKDPKLMEVNSVNTSSRGSF